MQAHGLATPIVEDFGYLDGHADSSVKVGMCQFLLEIYKGTLIKTITHKTICANVLYIFLQVNPNSVKSKYYKLLLLHKMIEVWRVVLMVFIS